jgi:hypothetical protein
VQNQNGSIGLAPIGCRFRTHRQRQVSKLPPLSAALYAYLTRERRTIDRQSLAEVGANLLNGGRLVAPETVQQILDELAREGFIEAIRIERVECPFCEGAVLFGSEPVAARTCWHDDEPCSSWKLLHSEASSVAEVERFEEFLFVHAPRCAAEQG